ncbi:MAG: terminase small subunit, Nu1 [Alphaproteobacteria bacterium]|nr:terminase small subunit, Nu1 [Alphaproteobacteria bacterium]
MASNTQPVAVIARLLDLTERRVQQLVRQGVIPAPLRQGEERGRYDLVGAVRGYVRFLRDQAAERPGAGDVGAERARLIKAKADLAEMEAGLRRGELLPADDVEEAWIAVLSRLRARLLVLPDRLAPLVHEETSVAGTRESIRRAVAEALEELASLPAIARDAEGAGAARAGGAQGADDPGAATEPDDQ